MLSPASAESEICEWEAREAAKLGKRIIPAVIRPLEGRHAPRELTSLNYIYFYAEPKNPGSGFRSGLIELVEALKIDPQWLRDQTRYLQKATEWEAGKRPKNRLLSGGDIALAKTWAASRPSEAPPVTELLLDYINASETWDHEQQNEARKQLERMAEALAAKEEAQTARASALADKERALQVAQEASVREASASRLAAQQAQAAAEHQRMAAEQSKLAAEQSKLAAEQSKLAAGKSRQVARRTTIGLGVSLALLLAAVGLGLSAMEAERRAVSRCRELPSSQSAMPSNSAISPFNRRSSPMIRPRSPLQRRGRPRTPRVRATHSADMEREARGEALINQARYLAKTAVEKIAQGDAVLGALLALEAVPNGAGNGEAAKQQTVMPELEVALYKAMRGLNRVKDQQRLTGHTSTIYSVAVSPDGNRVVSGSADKTARVWDLRPGRPAMTLSGHTDEINGVAFSPDGTFIVTGGDDNVARIWNAATGAQRALLKHDSASLRSDGLRRQQTGRHGHQ